MKPTIIDNREGMGAEIVRSLRETTERAERVSGDLRVIHTATKATIDLWNQIRAIDEIEGLCREAYLNLERELGLIHDVEPEGTSLRDAVTTYAEPPDMVDAEPLTAIEAALEPTGWTETIEAGEAICVQLPGGLVVTVERPDEPHAAAVAFGERVYALLADHWRAPNMAGVFAYTADGTPCAANADLAATWTFEGACERVRAATPSVPAAEALLFLRAVDGAFKGMHPKAWESEQDSDLMFGAWERASETTPLHLLAVVNRGIDGLRSGEVVAD